MTVALVGFFGILIGGCEDSGFGFVKAGKAEGGRVGDATVGVGHDALALPVAGDRMTVAHVRISCILVFV